jgi:hypothetical protein
VTTAPSPVPADVVVVPELPDAWPASGYGDVAVIAAQLPDPGTLAPGTRVVVHGQPRAPKGLLSRVFRGKGRSVQRAVRGSALLARGYVRLGGGADPKTGADLAWGFAP